MAYLLKAKKNIEEQDINEFKIKKEKVRQLTLLLIHVINIKWCTKSVYAVHRKKRLPQNSVHQLDGGFKASCILVLGGQW